MPGSTDYFSTHVTLWMECADKRINLAQVGANIVITAEPCTLPPNSTATAVVGIDGDEKRLSYLLPQGVCPDRPKSTIVVCDAAGLPF